MDDPSNARYHSSQPDRRARLSAWLNEPTVHELTSLLKSLRQARQLFLDELANRLAPVMNEYLQQQPRDTYDDKKKLAKWLNAELRALDLAVECPNTKMPALLVANTGDDPAHGRFQLNVALPNGRRTKTRSMTSLAELRLTGRDAGLDKGTLWQERSKHRDQRSR